MHPADLVEGLEDLQRASDNLVTDLDLDRDTLLEVNREVGRLVRRLHGIYTCEPHHHT